MVIVDEARAQDAKEHGMMKCTTIVLFLLRKERTSNLIMTNRPSCKAPRNRDMTKSSAREMNMAIQLLLHPNTKSRDRWASISKREVIELYYNYTPATSERWV